MSESKLVVIGGSAGSIEPLLQILGGIPADAPFPVLIVIHVAPTSRRMAEVLGRAGVLPTALASDGERLRPGRVYVARPDMHLIVQDGVARVFHGPHQNGFRPSIDALFKSAARSYGPGVVGVLLSGVLDCGSAGLYEIKQSGGSVMIQDPNEALFPDMPRNAIASGAGGEVLPAEGIAERLRKHGRDGRGGRGGGRRGRVAKVKTTHVALSELTCPECHGSLTERRRGPITEFACHVGHTFTVGGLHQQQIEDLERVLWSSVRALRESQSLAKRLPNGHSVNRQHARSLGNLADHIEEFLLGEPAADPTDQGRMASGKKGRLHKSKPRVPR